MELSEGGWQPPQHISEEEYLSVKNNPTIFPLYYVGYVGFHATFGAKYFGGYARGFKEDKITPRDMSNEAYRNTSSQIPFIKDVCFVSWDYRDVLLTNAVIYCDPPYANTTKYAVDDFNHDEFWSWCRLMSKNNYVFISEYTAPDDFECIWQKNVTTSLKVDKHEERIEKLFVYKP